MKKMSIKRCGKTNCGKNNPQSKGIKEGTNRALTFCVDLFIISQTGF
ncbi:hypothetical protein NBRC111894_2778 [Sporolactobacillus inulinus]|uniref:Uncharacterized protein n=1 Tax=Sporolactobacillus inulinus TaxID=2078 RepID=A0A4Y1ZE40_9BACL|nr:hypothetical protein NBRC111894_2778 [Sporolactobacillus inulinus]